jgi:hypothetical protein
LNIAGSVIKNRFSDFIMGNPVCARSRSQYGGVRSDEMNPKPKVGRRHRYQVPLLFGILFVTFGLLLTQCPANRDGMPGQLAQSMKETTSAARSAALALDLRLQGRSTNQLTGVQISDARQNVVKAYKGIADLDPDNPADVGRQRMLTQSMTTIIGQLNAASATLRQVTTGPGLASARDDLIKSAEALENGYR